MISMRFIVGVGVCFLYQAWAGAQTFNLDRLIERAIDSHPSVRSQLSNEKSAQLFDEAGDQNLGKLAQRAIAPKSLLMLVLFPVA